MKTTLKVLILLGALALALTSCGRNDQTHEIVQNDIQNDDISGLETQFKSLAENGFIDSYKLTDDHMILTVTIIKNDWKAITLIQREELARKLFDVYAHFCKKNFSKKSTMFLCERNQDGSIKPKILGFVGFDNNGKIIYKNYL